MLVTTGARAAPNPANRESAIRESAIRQPANRESANREPAWEQLRHNGFEPGSPGSGPVAST